MQQLNACSQPFPDSAMEKSDTELLTQRKVPWNYSHGEERHEVTHTGKSAVELLTRGRVPWTEESDLELLAHVEEGDTELLARTLRRGVAWNYLHARRGGWHGITRAHVGE